MCRISLLTGLHSLRSLLDEDVFIVVRVLCGCLLFASSVFALFVFCSLLIFFFLHFLHFLHFLRPFLATMFVVGYFLVRFLLPAFSACFIFSKCVTGLVWFGSVYLVTTAGFVAE